jgi:hypothetical protein
MKALILLRKRRDAARTMVVHAFRDEPGKLAFVPNL